LIRHSNFVILYFVPRSHSLVPQPTDSTIPTAQRATPPNAPSLPPRPPTPLAVRRSWTDPGTRVWWILAGLILLMCAALIVDRVWLWVQENQLIRNGTVVTAEIVEANTGSTVPHQLVEMDEMISVQFNWKGQQQTAVGYPRDRTQHYLINQKLNIRVDPNDPTTWTDLTQNEPLMLTLFVGLMILPIPPVLVLIAALKRKQIWKTWQTGDGVVAVVAERRQTPVAPGAYAVRCSMRDSRDRRLFTVYLPRRGGDVAKDDLIWLIVPKEKKARPLAAGWFQ
jgi:hypothetical protein